MLWALITSSLEGVGCFKSYIPYSILLLPCARSFFKIQGPVVQSIVCLTSSLVVKMLTVLVSTISNSQLFLLKKCEQKKMQKLLTFFQQKY